MSTRGLDFIIRWFAAQCDGDWEHDVGIRIETLDNPGWRVRVRISETSLEGQVQEWITWASPDAESDSWMHWRSTGTEFEAACGARDLARALSTFADFAITCEGGGGRL